MRIFEYNLQDGLGDYMRLIIQAETREQADELGRREVEHDKRYRFPVPSPRSPARELTDRSILYRDVFDHEVGGSVGWGGGSAGERPDQGCETW